MSQIKVVVWKNLIIRKRHWFLTIIEALLPVCLFLLIAYGRSQISGLNKVEFTDPTFNYKEGINYGINVGNTYILYTPGGDYYTDLISKMHAKLSLPSDQVQRFGTEKELLEYYYKNSNYTIIAIIFDDKDKKKLKYKLRYHESGSFNKKFLSTGDKYQNAYSFQPGIGGAYKSSDFLAVQMALDMAFLEYNSKQTDLEEKYSIVVEEFPYPPYKLDSAITKLFLEFLPLITLFSFIFLCPAVLKRVVEEKHSGIKELMKMVGMKSWMLWLGWFIYGMIPIFFSISIIIILMKVPMFGSTYPLIEYSSGGILFCFLILYCMAAIAFCFAISSFFSRPTIALVTGILVWILSFFVPKYALGLDESNQLSWSTNIILNLLPNMALHYGYAVISVFEEREIGVQWSNFSDSTSGSAEDITLLNIYLMLIFDTLIYTIFTFYMDGVNPGKYGVKKKIFFPIIELFKMCRKPTDTVKVDTETQRLEKIEDGIGLRKGIEISNLHKRFGHKVAVNNLNLDIYAGQITVLLGHNGAGKSTTMSVITGMLQATSGSVKINGLDTKRDMDEIRKSLGLCPQHNLFFTDLTVKEHLLFFAKLKGMSSDDASVEADNLLKILNMTKKTNSMAHSLSGGMQRKLGLGMAVIGGSKVLILDEPSSGMDPESRRHLWDLLLEWRGDRTILITTHFMEEADALADWIAIMSNGTLNCYGTPMYLKKKYDIGYHLSLMVESTANISDIKSEVTKYIHDAQLKFVDGNNLTFVLPSESNPKMKDVLTNLETKKSELKLTNISVTVTSLEDVFLKTHLESNGHHNDNCNNSLSVDPKVLDIQGLLSYDSIGKREPQLNLKLATLLHKRWQFFCSKKFTYAVPALITLVFFILTGVLSGGNDYCNKTGPELNLKLGSYKQTSVFYNGTTNNNDVTKMMRIYRNIVEDQKSLPFNVIDTEHSILKKSIENIAYYREHMIAGATFNADKTFELVALYNAIPIHSMPISLNLLTNTLAQFLLGPDYSISLSNWPLPHVNQIKSSQELSHTKIGILWLILIPIGCLFIHGSFIIFPHTEISTKFVKIQYMCGVKPICYWLVNFLADMVLYMGLMLTLGFILWIISPVRVHFGYLTLIFLLYGLAGIPFTYLFSRKTSASGAFALLIIMGMFLGIIFTITIEILLHSQDEYYMNIGNHIKYVSLLLIPQVGLCDALLNLAKRAVMIHNINMSPAKMNMVCIGQSHVCCNENSKECIGFRNYSNLFDDYFIMIACCFIYLTINIVLDAYWFMKVKSVIIKHYHRFRSFRKFDYENLQYDKTEMTNKNIDDGLNTLKAEKLSKLYEGKQIVKNLNLTLKRGECLGILGVNGAGKTTTFRMLTRDEMVDGGSVLMELENKKITIDMDEYMQTLGYCPQSDSLNYVLTGRQILTTIGALRGISDKNEITKYLELFDLLEYADVPCGYYSGGNKRKLSLAISLIGFREFVLLDEPTNGIDPSSRRKCWSLIKTLQKEKGFILTSHSMNECEALCNELKIMKDGKFVEQGSLADLKNKFGGFTLKLKISNKKTPSEISDDVDEVDGVDVVDDRNEVPKFSTVEDIKKYFTKNDRAELKDEHSGLLHFHIKDKNKRWSDIFKEVENIKSINSHLIEDYAISEASLEDVFLKVARSGTEEGTIKRVHENKKKLMRPRNEDVKRK
ncbi:ATP-binding cassette sub-family A member 2-like isoform X1 [Diorhabda carinulata]|uniref:ATP-binding cassette sub-family A member 2-like isoform X1 n=1 Tax=Diorhabda carinulata TaxID=1163345 RepID=UPI0025A2E422|nr:ATP-binding cassette sub-family A member 2-like isoform X1 [Diorhabda carinulata]XP_057653242.1 ATP-binding cassette sub-family A member 2-like isoform X1 [Diorhabda carinulata]